MRAALVFCVLLAAVGLGLLPGLRAPGPGDPPRSVERAGALGARAVRAAGFDGGDFFLTDHEGRRVSAARYGDRLLLLTFGTTASQLADLTLALMPRTLACLGPDAERLQALFVALGRDHQDGRPLARYLASFDPRIMGLRGTADEIRRLGRSYRVRHEVAEAPQGTRVEHSAFLYLAGGGRLHSYYPPSISAEQLCNAVRDLLRG